MTVRARWFSGAFVGLGLLLASQAFFVSVSSATPDTASTPSGSACAALKRWAESYRDARPTLDELATFDRAHRIAIFNAVAPEVRSALWQDQLHRFAQRTDLTNTQRALIAEGSALMTPALYERESQATEALRSFWSHADREFSSVSSRRSWFEIGSVLNEAELSTSRSINGNCSCNTSFTECGSRTCTSSSCTQVTGCGPGGAFFCNGTCQ